MRPQDFQELESVRFSDLPKQDTADRMESFYDDMVIQDGEGRVGVVAFSLICKKIQRDPFQFASFLQQFTGTAVKMTEDGDLQTVEPASQMEFRNACQTYFDEFVLCKMCKSLHTRSITSNLQGDERLYISCGVRGCMYDHFIPTKKQMLAEMRMDDEIQAIAWRKTWR